MSYNANTPAALAERLARRTVINPLTGCYEWTGSRPGGRYGQIRPGGNEAPIGAHRAAWMVARGRIPEGMVVCHRCDNPCCVRVDHLFIGTQADNMADLVAKRRQSGDPNIARARLNERDVIAIRGLHSNGVSLATLASSYGVNASTIEAAVAGRTWREVPREGFPWQLSAQGSFARRTPEAQA